MRRKVTINDLKKLFQRIEESPIPNIIRIGYSLEMWKEMRKEKYFMAQWTDEEIENRDKDTGIIGIKNGVECYVTTEISKELMNITIQNYELGKDTKRILVSIQ